VNPSEEQMDTSDRTVIDRFNAAAERRFSEFVATDIGLRHETRKPFCCTVCAPQLVYKLGLMLYAMDLRPGLRVLDFGTGAGWLARMINQLGLGAAGIDVAESAIEFARAAAVASPQLNPDVALEYATYDGYRFPFADATFDRVACFDAFHHIPNKQAIFAEFARVLADGGRATFVEPGGHHHESDQAKSETKSHGVLEDSVSLDDMIGLAEGAGLGGVEIAPYPPGDRLRFSEEQYRDFMRGNDAAYKLGAIRRDLRYAFIVTFTKGAPRATRRKRFWLF
jgi:SAM-dependent methyltransferase